MKKTVLVLSLLTLVVGAVWYFVARLDLLVQRRIEAVGSAATGTAVTVAAVDVDLRSATATISGLSVANPPGFSEATLLHLGELVLTLDPSRVGRNSIGIHTIVARDARLHYEQRDGRTNLQALNARSGSPQAPAGPVDGNVQPGTRIDDATALRLAIDRLLVEQVTVTLHDAVLPIPVEVGLGDFTLQDLAGTPAEVAEQAFGPLMAQLGDRAATAMLAATAAQLGEDARSVGRQALERAGQGLRAVGDTLGEAGSRVREGLGRLFDGDEPEQTTAPAPQTGPAP